MSYKAGQKVFVKDYKCSGGQAVPILRPAEISYISEGSGCAQIRFLDAKFCKGGRAKHSQTCLLSNIVERSE